MMGALLTPLLAVAVIAFIHVGYRCTAKARRLGWIICRTETLLDIAVAATALAIWTVHEWLTAGPFAGGFAVALLTALWTPGHLRAWRRHRKHDEDCEYGPRRRRGGSVRLVQWRKVALNPAFTPT